MAASRNPRRNAGANMASLIKDFHEEEAFTTLYGGFSEEVDDKEFGLDEISDDGSDIDFDEVDEDLEDDIEEGRVEEDDGKRKRRKPAKYLAALKRKNAVKTPIAPKRIKVEKPVSLVSYAVSDEDEDEDSHDETPSTSSGDGDDSRDASLASDFVTPVKSGTLLTAASGRSIRDSTAAKRFETEELEMVRAQRRQEIGPRKKVKHHVPTQRERLARSVHTEKKNRADLERHERDEEENEKKKSRKPKAVRGPFINCFISTTQHALSLDELENTSDFRSRLMDPFEDDSNQPPLTTTKCSRSLLGFKEELFEQTFSPWKQRKDLPDIRICMATGKPARYRDPVTQQYYYDSKALQTIRGVIYRHFVANPVHLGRTKVMEYIQWYEDRYNDHRRGEHSQVGSYDYSMNVVNNNVPNGDAVAADMPTGGG